MHFQLTKIGGKHPLITNITVLSVTTVLLFYWVVNHFSPNASSYVMVHVPDITYTTVVFIVLGLARKGQTANFTLPPRVREQIFHHFAVVHGLVYHCRSLYCYFRSLVAQVIMIGSFLKKPGILCILENKKFTQLKYRQLYSNRYTRTSNPFRHISLGRPVT
jgi:hypothetical protein